MPVLPVGGADVAASGSRARPPPIVLYERFEDRVRPKSYRVILSPVGGARVAVRRYVPELVLALSVELRYFASGIRMTLAEHPAGFGITYRRTRVRATGYGRLGHRGAEGDRGPVPVQLPFRV